MMDPQRIFQHYEQGNLTQTEVSLELMRCTTEDNALRVVASIPADLLRSVNEYLATCPATEKQWSRWQVFRIAMRPRGTTAEQVEKEDAEERRQLRRGVEILRDVLGPYPSPEARIDPVWLAWNDGTVARLAQAIYEERTFERMPILADALEEAGCGNAEILSHCRGPGPHVRGCWVVDLVLGRE